GPDLRAFALPSITSLRPDFRPTPGQPTAAQLPRATTDCLPLKRASGKGALIVAVWPVMSLFSK
ncbi:hypothetical protein XENOCAPTIV_028706, partial [Xenoophorus captivus]